MSVNMVSNPTCPTGILLLLHDPNTTMPALFPTVVFLFFDFIKSVSFNHLPKKHNVGNS